MIGSTARGNIPIMISVDRLRFQYTLPNRQLATLAAQELTSVIIRKRAKGLSAWQAEQFIELRFNNETREDERPALSKVCSSCGLCCKNLPARGAAVYMTHAEIERASEKHETISQDDFQRQQILVTGSYFHVAKTKPNGDCIFLGENGCSLGEDRPLWCKIYYCEKLYGGEYPYESVVPVPEIKVREPLRMKPVKLVGEDGFNAPWTE